MSQVSSIFRTLQNQQPQKQWFLSFKAEGMRSQTMNVIRKLQGIWTSHGAAHKSRRSRRAEWENAAQKYHAGAPRPRWRCWGTEPPLQLRSSAPAEVIGLQLRSSAPGLAFGLSTGFASVLTAPNLALHANSLPQKVAERSPQNLVILSYKLNSASSFSAWHLPPQMTWLGPQPSSRWVLGLKPPAHPAGRKVPSGEPGVRELGARAKPTA